MKSFFGAHPRTPIYLAIFFFSLHLGLTAYVNSSLLAEALGFGQKNVGLIFMAASVLAIVATTYIPRVTHRISVKTLFMGAALVHMLGALMLAITQVPVLGLLVFLAYNLSGGLVMFLADLLIEHHTADTETGNVRGLYLTIQGIPWMLAPLVAGLVSERLGMPTIYIIGAVLSAIVLLVGWATFTHFREQANANEREGWAGILQFFSIRPLRQIFKTQFLLNVFYATMVIYSPLYLHEEIGLSWEHIGFIFSIMLLAFVLLQYQLGRLADRYWGEKEILSGGFLLMGASTVLVGLGALVFPLAPWWIWAIVFFVTRAGAASVEVMNESYFYKHVDDDDVEFISTYRNSGSAAYIVAPLLISLLLTLTPIAYHTVFIILGVVMLGGLLVAVGLEDTR